MSHSDAFLGFVAGFVAGVVFLFASIFWITR